MITKDPQAIRTTVGFVLGGSNAELEAKLEATTDRAESRRMFGEWIGEQAARIEAVYTARYLVEGHRGITVIALLFKEGVDHQQTEGRTVFGKQGQRITKRSMVITVATDGEDPSCYDAIRRFLEQIE
jgi:hypothetical protein